MSGEADGFEAIVLAGGLGTRLRSVVSSVPKVLAPVAGRPFLAHVLSRLRRAGCARVVVAVGHLREQVMQQFRDRFEDMPVRYSIEESPLGTGGAIRKALAGMAGARQIVLNGDTWMEVDYGAMLALHENEGARLTVAVTALPDVARYGAVEIDDQRRILRFSEKGESKPGLINGGVYAVERGIFGGFLLPAAFSFETDFMAPCCTVLRPVAFLTRGLFVDIGVPADYALAQDLLRERAGK